MTRKMSVAAVTAAALLSFTACSGSEQGGSAVDDPDIETSFRQLMNRPTIDEATQRYTEMQQNIMRELAATIPGFDRWQQVSDGGNAGCVKFDGGTRNLPLQGIYQNLPDDRWDDAVRLVGRTAVKYGFEPKPLVLHDEPGSHDVAFHNVNDDSRISFGTGKNTSISVKVGCHLTAEAKRRGKPNSGGAN